MEWKKKTVGRGSWASVYLRILGMCLHGAPGHVFSWGLWACFHRGPPLLRSGLSTHMYVFLCLRVCACAGAFVRLRGSMRARTHLRARVPVCVCLREPLILLYDGGTGAIAGAEEMPKSKHVRRGKFCIYHSIGSLLIFDGTDAPMRTDKQSREWAEKKKKISQIWRLSGCNIWKWGDRAED